MFKDKFKSYKKKMPVPSFQDVLNVRVQGDSELLTQFELRGKCSPVARNYEEFGLQHPSLWKTFELKNHPGLVFVVNPFTNCGQRYWIARSVADYSAKPNITNISQQNDLCDLLRDRSWWDLVSCEETCDKNSVSRKLRWATMGYHHNWDTKVYSEDARGPFPADLELLSKFIVKVIFNIDFKPEAAIVNFYLMDSFLSGHIDRSELNTSAPLISFSFGQTAIFLIGGETMTSDPDAIFLESGDIILMAGVSRLQYHGVPKIIYNKNDCWNNFGDQDEKTSYLVDEKLARKCNHVTFQKVENRAYWIPFARYINQARINLNQINYHGIEKNGSGYPSSRQPDSTLRMKIFNISHLFQTPVTSSTDTNSQSKKSRRRRRKRRTPSNGCVQNASENVNLAKCTCASLDQDTPKPAEPTKPETEAAIVLPKSKKSKKKSGCDSTIKRSNAISSPRKNSQVPRAASASRCDSTQTKVTENMKQEMLELIHSVQTLASEKDILEKNLHELREENDRLVRNNEDLKDELKEMTDEALELTVEKQRLLSKIGVLKKQLLNRPK